jgi:hypothetical protein
MSRNSSMTRERAHLRAAGQPEEGLFPPAGTQGAADISTLKVDDRAAERAIVERVVPYRNRLLRRAKRLLHKFMVDEADLDAEGTVDLAIFSLCKLQREKAIDRDADAFALFKLGLQEVRWLIWDELKRSSAMKRGCAATLADCRWERGWNARVTRPARRRRIQYDLDCLMSNDSPAEDVVDERLEFELSARRGA